MLAHFHSNECFEVVDGRLICSLTPEERHHFDVRRIAIGEQIVVVDAFAHAYRIVVDTLTPSEVQGTVLEELPHRDTPYLTLFQGVSKGERMDLVVRMATELGVRDIVPLVTQRCIVKFDTTAKARAKQERWIRIAEAAAKQSGLRFVPHVNMPLDLTQALNLALDCDLRICAWEEAHAGSLHEVLKECDNKTHVALFIGPEGGLSPEEASLLEAHDTSLITLGDTILRTETAGIIASALVIHELGGLGNTSCR